MDWQLAVSDLLNAHPVAAPVVFVALRAVSVVLSPIPGALLDVPGIAIFGWKAGLVYAEIGVMTGASLCFAIARRYRERVLGRFVSLQRVQRWESELSGGAAFWTWLVLRVSTNAAFDYLSYAAGLTKCTWRMFLVTTFLGSLPNMILFYYLGGIVAEQKVTYAFAAIGFVLVAAHVIRYVKGRRLLRAAQSPDSPESS